MSVTARLAFLFAALLAAACGPAPTPVPQASSEPAEHEFVGSVACAGCHAAETARWRDSHHALAMQPASERTVLGRFDGREVGYFDETAAFSRRGDEFVVRALDGNGEARDYVIAYTFGVEPIQQYLVAFPGGRLQALPWVWDTRPSAAGGQRWLHLYPDEYVAPGDSLHWTGHRQNWNYMCAECHSTNVIVGYDARNDTFETRYDEVSVGCEACHGPGSEHVRQAEAGAFGAGKGLAVDLDDRGDATWVMNPSTGIAARSEPALRKSAQPEACGRCHARRATLDEPYVYGKPLADTHRVSLLDDGLYHADGQILDEVYVYGSFLQSRMYQAGVTCTDCHEPHSGELVTGAGDPSAVCAQCHSPAVFAAEAHMGHSPDAAGCVDCHMTGKNYMVVDFRRDHSFRVPRPDLAAQTGAPEACGTCHADRDAEWAARAIAEHAGGARRASFGPALAQARAGYANPQLVGVIGSQAFPGIARATAVTGLVPPYRPEDLQSLVDSLADPDPLVRMGALTTLAAFAPDEKARFAGTLLADPVKSVRIEAAFALADAFGLLDAAGRRAFNAAAAEFRRSRMISASQPDALLSLAGFEARLGNRDQARAAYQRALYLEPSWAAARANYADFLRQEGEDDLGETILREGIEFAPDDAYLRHALGLLLVRQDRPDAGLESLRTAVDLAPGNARFAYVLGVALNSLGRPDEAVDVLGRAWTEHRGDLDIGFAYADLLLREQGEIDAAREVALALLERFPDDPRARALFGRLGGRP
ncbi:MAG: tetratricopeptide repeat protein [Woeseiaceae bacterium]|jgi:Flp pilus assembly protein TadD|nr:tetratricopeptide repeat protein [Woeseiaceae bacterium]